KNSFQGDPYLYITENGSTIKVVGGQPIMDTGIENHIMISLFTRPGWWGNVLTDKKDEKIGSNFEEEASKAVTLTSLNRVRQAALSALDSPLFGSVDVEVNNPSFSTLKVVITVHPPTDDAKQLTLIKNGINWILQTKEPTYLKV
ncbi:MAG: hypothetical protein KAJ19_24915, partial [Gammaproteobacteria bacterium]|nr:hypothetical protein [Gammaproteobacteria bacterium]